MKESAFKIREIRINEMTEPLGIDIEKPLFSWLLEDEKSGMQQMQVRILVGTAPGKSEFWDSGLIKTDRSIGISYGGKKLAPCTRYYVTVTVWDQDDHTDTAETWFETGFLDSSIQAWDHAEWIGAPEFAVASDTLSVFVLEAPFRMERGGRAGIIFGANDRRLMDRYKNESLIEGRNYISFVVNTAGESAMLDIFRVGYDAADSEDVPFFTLPIKDIKTGEELITPENRHQLHTLKIEVLGNSAYTYMDGHLIDEEVREEPFGTMRGPRCLNPLGPRDVTTFPRLCDAGFYAGEGTAVSFPQGLIIRNRRTPCSVIRVLQPEGIFIDSPSRLIENPSCHALPMLRREFSVREGLAEARLYATARGIYDCRVNGHRVDDTFFAPGASQFDHHLMYQTYDITDDLQPGQNAVGCILASGWWSDSFSFLLDNCNYWGDRPSFLAKLVLTYEDGTSETIISDTENWDYFGEGPYRYAGFFNGEQYDARLSGSEASFFRPGFDSDEMKKPAEIIPVPIGEREPMFPGAAVWPAVNQQEPALTGNYQAPVRASQLLTAVSMTEPRPGVYIYDLGQEIAGMPVIRLREKAGTRVTVRYGEVLYPDLPRYRGLEGLMLQANLREAGNTDIYICRGDEEEVYQPLFTFHGYRYIEITGVTAPPAPEDVQSLLLSSVDKITGTFSCSDPLVNRFVKNVQYSQYNNFISIPTDCPQRNERMGWLGDTHVFCHAAVMQSNVKNFYIRNLQAMRDLQLDNGRLPCIAPFGGGFGGQTYESAMILIVHELYLQYGDRELVEEYFPAMDAWMDSIAKTGLPGRPDIMFIEWLGDWLAPEPTDPFLVFNAFHYRNARIMASFAELTGNAAAVRKYEDIAEKTREFWNSTFVDPETGMARSIGGELCDVQGSYAIALSCGVYNEKYKEKAYEHLARKTREANHTIHTGFFGTGPLNPMLSEGGFAKDALAAMTQTAYPGWLYPVTQGATTIWERWNSFTSEEGFGENNSMNSFDHYSLGSVVSWLYEYVLGIRRLDKHPGYKRFELRPDISAFPFAQGGIDTPHGRIESAWREENSQVVYTCRIPANTTCALFLSGEKHELASGRYEFRLY